MSSVSITFLAESDTSLVSREEAVRRFIERVSVGPSGCWLWTGATDGQGRYGLITIDGRQMTAHRAAHELFVGPIPPGHVVCHSCDVTLCVRPSHLWAGTQRDNLADMIAKGRAATGEKNGSRRHPERLVRGDRCHNAKLSDSAVMEIRLMRERGHRLREIGERFGISESAVCRIVGRKRWTHV